MSVTKEKHWGEFEDSNDDAWEEHSEIDIEELLTPQHYPPTSTALHQPSHQLTSSFQILSSESCRSDVTVQNTIRLLQHTRHVSHLINRALSLGSGSSSNNNNSSSNGEAGSTLPACPAMPAEIPLPRTPLTFHPLNFLPPQATQFTSGREGGLGLEVEHSTARKMLRQAVALVCAHAGFTETTDTVLRTLTDLTHHFLTNFTKLYRTNIDQSILLDNYCAFHEVLEQTMQEVGIGGMLDLHNMYKHRVQGYHNNVKVNALQLTHHYNMLVNKQQLQQQQQQQLQQQQLQQQQQQIPRRDSTSLPSTGSSDWWQQNSSSVAYTNVIPTAGGGSINITIGGGGAFPGISSTAEGAPSRGPVRGSASNSSLEQELARQYTPTNLTSGEADGRSQNSPLATHFTINPR